MVKFITFTVLVLQGVTGQIPSLLQPCPNVEVVQNFDVAKYMGKWYEQEKYPMVFELGGKCITAEYSAKNDGTVQVLNKMIRLGLPSSIEGTARLDSRVGEAKLLVSFHVPFTVTAPYWILGTDYTSFSVVWSCQNIVGSSALQVRMFQGGYMFEVTYTKIGEDRPLFIQIYSLYISIVLPGWFSKCTAWILTREQNPPQNVIQKSYDVLKKQNISTSLLVKTNQNNCN